MFNFLKYFFLLGLGDFNQIPPTNLIQVLQMEMKMAVNSKGFLISGYPRSMRDVVEYNKKVFYFNFFFGHKNNCKKL